MGKLFRLAPSARLHSMLLCWLYLWATNIGKKYYSCIFQTVVQLSSSISVFVKMRFFKRVCCIIVQTWRRCKSRRHCTAKVPRGESLTTADDEMHRNGKPLRMKCRWRKGIKCKFYKRRNQRERMKIMERSRR